MAPLCVVACFLRTLLIPAVTAKGTGPQDRTGPQGRSRHGRNVSPPTGGPVGHPPNPATLCDRSAQGSKS